MAKITTGKPLHFYSWSTSFPQVEALLPLALARAPETIFLSLTGNSYDQASIVKEDHLAQIPLISL